MRRAPGRIARRVVRRRAAPQKVVPASVRAVREVVVPASVRAVREVVVPVSVRHLAAISRILVAPAMRAAVARAGRTRGAAAEVAEVAGMTVSATGVRPTVTSAR